MGMIQHYVSWLFTSALCLRFDFQSITRFRGKLLKTKNFPKLCMIVVGIVCAEEQLLIFVGNAPLVYFNQSWHSEHLADSCI